VELGGACQVGLAMTGPVPFTLWVEIKIQCHYCPASRILVRGHVLRGNRILEVAPPEEWRVLDGELVCPDHSVTVTGVNKES